MSYIEKNLIPGETVLYETRLHWVVMIWSLVGGALLACLALLLLMQTKAPSGAKNSGSGGSTTVGFALLAGAAIVIVIGFVRRNATEMAVTNKRVVIKKGLMSRQTIELLLGKVESIQVNESASGRMLGYGSLLIRGTGGTQDSFEMIGHPLEFRTQVQQQIEKMQPVR